MQNRFFFLFLRQEGRRATDQQSAVALDEAARAARAKNGGPGTGVRGAPVPVTGVNRTKMGY